MSKEKLRVGIIGAGGNSRLRHIPGFRAIEGVELTAVVNRTRESGEAAAKEFNIPRVYEDWRDLVADPEIDAICIGTWPNLHCEATCAAMESGKHVLCEARMARDSGEARRMLAASLAHPGLVAQIVPSPFTLGVDERIAAVISRGDLGELLEVRIRFLNGALRNPATPINWRMDPLISGKNTMTLGILHEAILRWVSCENPLITASPGWGSAERPDSDGELVKTMIPESLQLTAVSTGGPRLLYDLSQLHTGPEEISIRVNGSRGSLFVDLVASEVIVAKAGGEIEKFAIPDGWDVEGEFVRSIREGTPVSRTSFPDGVVYMEFTEAVWEAWTLGPVSQ